MAAAQVLRGPRVPRAAAAGVAAGARAPKGSREQILEYKDLKGFPARLERKAVREIKASLEPALKDSKASEVRREIKASLDLEHKETKAMKGLRAIKALVVRPAVLKAIKVLKALKASPGFRDPRASKDSRAPESRDHRAFLALRGIRASREPAELAPQQSSRMSRKTHLPRRMQHPPSFYPRLLRPRQLELSESWSMLAMMTDLCMQAS